MENIVLEPKHIKLLEEGATLIYIGAEGMPTHFIRLQPEEEREPKKPEA